MSRRSTPERLDAAQRAGTRRRLTLDGLSEATADAWIAAWEAQAARDGLLDTYSHVLPGLQEAAAAQLDAAFAEPAVAEAR